MLQPIVNVITLSNRIMFLREVLLFALLNDTDLATVAKDFHVREYPEGTVVFNQGDPSRRLYVVVDGKVRICKVSPSGAETSINIFARYGIIGEFATVDNQPRSATARAICPCTLLEINSITFLSYMRQMPDLALGMSRTLSSKVRWTADYAETIAQYDAPGRLLHILLLYNEQLGEEEIPGKRYVLDIALNQSDLASLIGARREWVNRLLRDWQKRGLVEYEAGKIIILDLPRVIAERDGRIEAIQAV